MITPPLEDDLRYELKFFIDEWHYDRLQAWLRMRSEGFRPAYPSRKVNSVYYDRGDFEFYRDSVEGLSSRVKIRYRWYGESMLPQAGRLEVKHKRNQLGWKLVFDVETLDGTLPRWPEIGAHISDHLPPEGRMWFQLCDRPLIVTSYKREYWESGDRRLRITLDRQLATFDQRYSSEVNLTKKAPLDPGVVVEVKCGIQAVSAASKLIGELPLTLCRNSKYCEALDAIAGT